MRAHRDRLPAIDRCAGPPMKPALAVGALWVVLAAAAAPCRAVDEPPPLICSAGQLACRGPHSSACFTPSRGAFCSQGQVCNIGQSACVGAVGQGCYQPSRGEICVQGLVCQAGQSACVRGREGRCYTPSRGESCQ
jgi:hypothetical protein